MLKDTIGNRNPHATCVILKIFVRGIASGSSWKDLFFNFKELKIVYVEIIVGLQIIIPWMVIKMVENIFTPILGFHEMEQKKNRA